VTTPERTSTKVGHTAHALDRVCSVPHGRAQASVSSRVPSRHAAHIGSQCGGFACARAQHGVRLRRGPALGGMRACAHLGRISITQCAERCSPCRRTGRQQARERGSSLQGCARARSFPGLLQLRRVGGPSAAAAAARANGTGGGHRSHHRLGSPVGVGGGWVGVGVGACARVCVCVCVRACAGTGGRALSRHGARGRAHGTIMSPP